MDTSGPYMHVLDGSIKIEKSRVVLTCDIVRATLEKDILNDVPGAKLEHLSSGTVHGDPYARYRLTVEGDALRCAAVQNAIISTICGETDKRDKFVKLAGPAPS